MEKNATLIAQLYLSLKKHVPTKPRKDGFTKTWARGLNPFTREHVQGELLILVKWKGSPLTLSLITLILISADNSTQ